ncbi:MAG TPA: alanine racemase [Spirochaetia bacterium]|nr:alanine racemase [Spirochaetia bacterium]
MRATKAIIHLGNLRRNIRTVRTRVGDKVRICMAVKANAYGHGAVTIARTALSEGVYALGVATVGEGIELREVGLTARILLLSLPSPAEFSDLIRHDLSPFVADETTITLLEKGAAQRQKRVPVHLKVDTGMGRIGCRPDEAPRLAARIHASSGLTLAGVATHFPVSDRLDSPFTEEQIERFGSLVAAITRNGIDIPLVHAANSGAIISHPRSSFDMVRPGIMLYGYAPSSEQAGLVPLSPVMELVTEISFIKRVPAGTGISYGLTFTTDRETCIATLPVGYGDGYSRLLSNRGHVLIRGRSYPVVGRVCMDQTMVDLGPHPQAAIGDTVVLFGPEPGALDAAGIAALMGTIPYEVTCLVTGRVPRVFMDDEEVTASTEDPPPPSSSHA